MSHREPRSTRVFDPHWDEPSGTPHTSDSASEVRLHRRLSGKDYSTLMPSTELITEIHRQIATGRLHRDLKVNVAVQLEHMSKKEQELRDLRRVQEQILQQFLEATEGRDFTEEEAEKGDRLASEIDVTESRHRQLKTDMAYLADMVQAARINWMRAVEKVQALQEYVFVKGNFIASANDQHNHGNYVVDRRYGPDKDTSPFIPAKEFPQRHFNYEETQRLQVEIQVRKCRNELLVAHDKHEQYRDTYHQRLEAFSRERAGRSKTAIREEFSGEWLKGWRKVIQALDTAERALAKALEDAAQAGIDTYQPNPNDESNTPYDVEWLGEALIKHLNREGVEEWLSVVPRGAEPDLPPVGLWEVQLEKEALKERCKTSTSGIDTCRLTAYEKTALRDATTVRADSGSPRPNDHTTQSASGVAHTVILTDPATVEAPTKFDAPPHPTSQGPKWKRSAPDEFNVVLKRTRVAQDNDDTDLDMSEVQDDEDADSKGLPTQDGDDADKEVHKREYTAGDLEERKAVHHDDVDDTYSLAEDDKIAEDEDENEDLVKDDDLAQHEGIAGDGDV